MLGSGVAMWQICCTTSCRIVVSLSGCCETRPYSRCSCSGVWHLTLARFDSVKHSLSSNHAYLKRLTAESECQNAWTKYELTWHWTLISSNNFGVALLYIGNCFGTVVGRPYYRSRLWYSVSSVCRLLRFVFWQNGWTDLHEIFREGVEWPWDDLITFWAISGKPRDADYEKTAGPICMNAPLFLHRSSVMGQYGRPS